MNVGDLQSNKTDNIASILSASLGAVPVAGSFLSELVTQVIPEQRMDRVVKFIMMIAEELDKQKIDIELLRNRCSDQYKYGAYVSKCFRYVSSEIYEEKIEYYKNLCITGIIGDEVNLIHNERILQILGNLDFYEIQYLRYYYFPTMAKTEMMKDAISKIGFDILFPLYTMGMNEEKIIEETYKQITLNNLVKAGLLRVIKDGGRNHKSYEITTLGRVLLKKIGYDEIKVF